jgi:hypothetical protein
MQSYDLHKKTITLRSESNRTKVLKRALRPRAGQRPRTVSSAESVRVAPLSLSRTRCGARDGSAGRRFKLARGSFGHCQ